MKTRKKTFQMIIVFFLFVVIAPTLFAVLDNRGTEFWIGFMTNGGYTENKKLIITAELPSAGVVSIPGLSWTMPFTTTPGLATIIDIPLAAHAVNSDTIENVAIHVTSDNEISIYGLSQITASTDAYLALPVDVIGDSYIVAAYANGGGMPGSEFMVVASQDNTVVTITPSVTVGVRTAGITYTITLNTGQIYQLKASFPSTYATDITGTIVTSDKPISNFPVLRGWYL